MGIPETRYAATADGLNIAYQVVGDGAVDLVYVPGFVSHIELSWEWPSIARSYRELASFSRLILFDKRGTGVSDRVPDNRLPDLETRMDDLCAVMDAAGSKRAVVLAASEGAPLAILFAATHPERTLGLVLIGGYARELWAADYPWGWSPSDSPAAGQVPAQWGSEELTREIAFVDAPSEAADPEFVNWFGEYLRRSASPTAAIALSMMNDRIDVRAALPVIRVPTLVIHREDEENAPRSRHLADTIHGAEVVELPGHDHSPWSGDLTSINKEIRRFCGGVQHEWNIERSIEHYLATVLVTEIVDTTHLAASLGQRTWSALLVRFDRMVRTKLGRFRGKEIDAAGEGHFATFDGPARAVRCACAIVEALHELGMDARAGLHTGECTVEGRHVGGVAVQAGERVAQEARAGEVLVTRAVKDLVAGSGLLFEDAGEHAFRGVPGSWRLYRVLGVRRY
jgi:pimeloyl-ACP methyl ester carboxylesterase/class 3 adenylate cyclase